MGSGLQWLSYRIHLYSLETRHFVQTPGVLYQHWWTQSGGYYLTVRTIGFIFFRNLSANFGKILLLSKERECFPCSTVKLHWLQLISCCKLLNFGFLCVHNFLFSKLQFSEIWFPKKQSIVVYIYIRKDHHIYLTTCLKKVTDFMCLTLYWLEMQKEIVCCNNYLSHGWIL